MSTDNQTRRTFLRRSAATAAAVGVAGVGTGAVAADENIPEGLFADESFTRTRTSIGFVHGLQDSLVARVTSFVDDQPDIDTHVDAAVETFESQTTDWVDYVNDRDLGGSERQTAELTFEFDGEERTRYVIADWDDADERYQSIDIQLPDEFDGDADHWATISGDAVSNAADELDAVHERFIEPNEDITSTYASRLAGRYFFSPNEYVTASLLGG